MAGGAVYSIIPRFILLPCLVSVTLAIMFCPSDGFLLPGLLNKDKRFLHTSDGWPIFVLVGFGLPVSGCNLPGLVVRRPTSSFFVGGQTVVRGSGLGSPVPANVV